MGEVAPFMRQNGKGKQAVSAFGLPGRKTLNDRRYLGGNLRQTRDRRRPVD
jgi:hypothetical protein